MSANHLLILLLEIPEDMLYSPGAGVGNMALGELAQPGVTDAGIFGNSSPGAFDSLKATDCMRGKGYVHGGK